MRSKNAPVWLAEQRSREATSGSRPEVVESVAPAKQKNRKGKLVEGRKRRSLHQGWRAPRPSWGSSNHDVADDAGGEIRLNQGNPIIKLGSELNAIGRAAAVSIIPILSWSDNVRQWWM